MDYNDGDLCNYALTSEIIQSVKTPYVIDIGADQGEWSLHVLKQNPSARILMFEPNPLSFKELQQRVQDSSSITCLNLAVSNKIDTLQLSFEGPHSNSRALSTSAVNCVTLEPYIIEHVDIIKIDTEGHDMIILESLFPYIEKGLVGSVVTEYTAYWYGKTIFECFTKTFHILEKMLSYYEHCYSLSRRGEPYLIELNLSTLEEFILTHYNNHIQTDLYFVNIMPTSIPIIKSVSSGDSDA